MRTGYAALVWVVTVAGCHHTEPETPVASAAPSDASSPLMHDAPLPAATLTAVVSVDRPVFARIADVRVTVVLTNASATPWPVRTDFLTAGSLSLEVRDASGARINPGPPPMPPAPDQLGVIRTLAPGEAMTFAADPAIAIQVVAGRYEIRFRGVPADAKNASLESPWVAFAIGRSVDPFRAITKRTTHDELVRLVGEPDRDVGSGLHIYEYDLADGTKIDVGYGTSLVYVHHRRADGSSEDLVH